MSFTTDIYKKILDDISQRKDFPGSHASRLISYKGGNHIVFSINVISGLREAFIALDELPDHIDFPKWHGIAIDVVQLQLNYLDWESKLTESRKNYEICEKFGKDVIVMEPIKGGTLYNLPDDIKEKFEKEGMTLVEAALRFAGSHENVKVVLSGVGNLEQMKENCEVFKPFEPMSEEEEKFVLEMANEIKELIAIDCSYCGYCLKECPAGIPIPDFFELYNSEKMYSLPSLHAIYGTTAAANAPASACTECESCLAICTQKLDIPTLLKDVVNTFE